MRRLARPGRLPTLVKGVRRLLGVKVGPLGMATAKRLVKAAMRPLSIRLRTRPVGLLISSDEAPQPAAKLDNGAAAESRQTVAAT